MASSVWEVPGLPSVLTRAGRRARFVLGYTFAPALREKILELHPELRRDEADEAVEALRTWFVETIVSGRKGPPTGLVDEAWREFILMTKLYRQLCKGAFGDYFHYPP